LIKLNSDISKRRFAKFRRIKRSWYALIILVVFTIISLAADFIANNKPLIIYFKGNIYFPVFKMYPATVFGQDSILETDYKLLLKNPPEKLRALTPLLFWGNNESNPAVYRYPSPPSRDNPLGTDKSGRDVLTRLIYGFRVSMLFTFFNCVLALGIGILIGGLQGYYGGIADIAGQRCIEIWSAVPYLFVLLLLGSIFHPGFFILTLMCALFSWIGPSYYVRAECLRVRKEDYVLAARALGAGRLYILFRHVLPNSLTSVISFTPFILAGGISLLSMLDFLGFGVQPPTPSIGELLHQGKEYWDSAWWLALFPFLALFLVTLLLNFIGEGIRDVYNPRNVMTGKGKEK